MLKLMRAGLVRIVISQKLSHCVESVCVANFSFFLTLGAQSEVDYTEQLNFSDDDEQGSNQKERDSR